MDCGRIRPRTENSFIYLVSLQRFKKNDYGSSGFGKWNSDQQIATLSGIRKRYPG